MPRKGVDSAACNESLVAYNPSTPCPIPKHLSLPYCNDSCVLLVVGLNTDRFQVHQNRLFEASIWFKTTLESGMQETTTQEILLPTDDSKIVEIFVQWLYTAEPKLSAFTEESFTQLAKLYELANRLFIHELKNYIVWKLFELRRQEHVLPMSTVVYAFENLPDTAIFRKILVAWFTWHQESARTLTADMLNITPEFAIEIVLSMIKRQDGGRDILAALPQSHYYVEDA